MNTACRSYLSPFETDKDAVWNSIKHIVSITRMSRIVGG
jgi:hypothetical protein